MSIDPVATPRPRDRAASATRRAARATPRLEPTYSARYECKYLVDPRVLPALREFLGPFTEPDAFAAQRAGHRYPICSLYLDTADLRLYEQTVGGVMNRFKLRVRTYSDDPDTPAFFEVKNKSNNIVHKCRAPLDRAQARRMLTRRIFDSSLLGADERRDLEYFHNRVTLTEARPVLRIKYLREAYQALGNEPVRITIDTDLMHAVTLDDELSHSRGRFTATPVDGLILEIKFTERFPWWVQELVRRFGLAQRAVPKYVMSVDHLLLDGRETALSLAGITMPPLRRG